MHVLVCGGAGYIGSHMAKWLAARDVAVTVLDNLSTGHREAVQWGEVVQADLLDPAALERAFAGRRYDAVMHFCARSLVGESMTRPYDYYANNVSGTLVASSDKARRELGWAPQCTELAPIIESAWRWHTQPCF
jgi:UDP-glucose 4-epimerase